jgi:hypothetical protein
MKVDKNRTSKVFGFALCAMLFALCASAQAQQPGKTFRIGVLNGGTASSIAGLLEEFRRELGKLGWTEGKNITIEYRLPSKSRSACLSLRRNSFDLRLM